MTTTITAPNVRRGILPRVFGAAWAFMLTPAVLAAFRAGNAAHRAGGILLIGFALAYVLVMVTVRPAFVTGQRPFSLPVTVAVLLGFATLTAIATALLGTDGLWSASYVGVLAAVLLVNRGLLVTLAAAVGAEAAGWAINGSWSENAGLATGTLSAGLAVWGFGQMQRRNWAQVRAVRAESDEALLAERGRFSRDLHDLLGHSLTAITIKAELAGRLIDVDPARAKAETAELEALARDALRDVRRAVEGYREITLDGELARATEVLAAARVHTEVTRSPTPPDLEPLFAWTVREGVTNVLRHSGAGRCWITLGPDGVRIEDDGVGPDSAGRGPGNGVRGLTERAAATGAVVALRGRPGGGTILTVTPEPLP